MILKAKVTDVHSGQYHGWEPSVRELHFFTFNIFLSISYLVFHILPLDIFLDAPASPGSMLESQALNDSRF